MNDLQNIGKYSFQQKRQFVEARKKVRELFSRHKNLYFSEDDKASEKFMVECILENMRKSYDSAIVLHIDDNKKIVFDNKILYLQKCILEAENRFQSQVNYALSHVNVNLKHDEKRLGYQKSLYLTEIDFWKWYISEFFGGADCTIVTLIGKNDVKTMDVDSQLSRLTYRQLALWRLIMEKNAEMDNLVSKSDVFDFAEKHGKSGQSFYQEHWLKINPTHLRTTANNIRDYKAILDILPAGSKSWREASDFLAKNK